MAHCYSLWFIHLPAYVKVHHNKAKVLHVAFEVSRNNYSGIDRAQPPIFSRNFVDIEHSPSLAANL